MMEDKINKKPNLPAWEYENGEVQFNLDDYFYEPRSGTAQLRYQDGRGWICEICQNTFDPWWNWKGHPDEQIFRKNGLHKDRICESCTYREMKMEDECRRRLEAKEEKERIKS